MKKKIIRKKLKWWGWLLISASVIIALTGSGLLVGLHVFSNTDYEHIPGMENPHGFKYLGIRPFNGDRLNLEIPEDEEDTIALAQQLYNMGAENAKNTENMAVYNNCLSVFSLNNLDNYIDVDLVMIKDNNHYLRKEYHLKNNIPLFDLFPGFEESINNMVEMVSSQRLYHEKGMEKSVYQRVLNSEYDENGKPYADWSNLSKEEQWDVPIYNKNQQGIFELTQHYVSAENIKSASIEYLEDEKSYKVSIVLDEENPLTTQKSINAIRDGSGDKNARFTEIKIDFMLWDNGYFRSMEIYEKWTAKVLLTIKSEFENSFSFSYHEDDVDFSEVNFIN
ncbi:MAG: hypothetical protein ACOCWI_00355 [Bacillota bacterium]